MAKPSKPPRRLPDDIAVLHGPTEDGEGARMLRLRKGELFAGEVRPAREGQPIDHHEVVRLKPLGDLGTQARLCEVEVVHSPRAAAPAKDAPQGRSQGPVRVATERYRRNWGQVFGASRAHRSRDLPN